MPGVCDGPEVQTLSIAEYACMCKADLLCKGLLDSNVVIVGRGRHGQCEAARLKYILGRLQ